MNTYTYIFLYLISFEGRLLLSMPNAIDMNRLNKSTEFATG